MAGENVAITIGCNDKVSASIKRISGCFASFRKSIEGATDSLKGMAGLYVKYKLFQAAAQPLAKIGSSFAKSALNVSDSMHAISARSHSCRFYSERA